jgi:hypothetical protein
MNCSMRHVFIAGALIFAVIAPGGATAQERQYPWCARYDWTTYNCGFVSYAQCRATTFGAGGRCEPNPRFVPGEPRRKKQYRY